MAPFLFSGIVNSIFSRNCSFFVSQILCSAIFFQLEPAILAAEKSTQKIPRFGHHLSPSPRVK